MKQTFLSLQIALRFILKYKKNDVISFLSIISIISIILGVMVAVIGLSIMNGFINELNNRIFSVIPHGEIEFVEKPTINWHTILMYINNISGIIDSIPYVSFSGLAEYNNKFQIIQIRGLELFKEGKSTTISNFILKKSCKNVDANKKYIILGLGVANKLKVNIGDWITIIFPKHQQKNLLQTENIRLQVKGILALHGILDYHLAIVPLYDAQQYLHIGNNITGIAIRVANIFNADYLVNKASEIINTDVKSQSWINHYGYMYHDIQMIRIIIYLIMFLIFGISSFNIIAIIIISVKNKNTDITILRAIGANNNLIRNIFIYYGLLLSTVGSIIGVIVGIIITMNFTLFIKCLEKIIGHLLLSEKIYFINFVPIKLCIIDVIVILIITVIFSLLASWYAVKRINTIQSTKVLFHK